MPLYNLYWLKILAVGLEPGATPALHLLKQQMQSHVWEADLLKLEGITIARKTAELCLDQLCIIFLLVSARSLAHQTHLSFTSWLSGLKLTTVYP